jgi:hypothetical protein
MAKMKTGRMLNLDLRRCVENELHMRMRAAELTYRNAVSAAKKQREEFRDLGWGNPDGGYAYRSAIAAEREALESYRRALETFNNFLLYQKLPSPQRLLKPILTRAIDATGAQMGNIQAFDPHEESLVIKAQCGFKRPFLEFFASVHDEGGSTCGAALKAAQRVIVGDVTTSPIFAGTAALEVLLDAGVRACQSTPLLSPAGELVGMLSTHYGKPTQPTDRDFETIDQVAAQAAAFLMGCRRE